MAMVGEGASGYSGLPRGENRDRERRKAISTKKDIFSDQRNLQMGFGLAKLIKEEHITYPQFIRETIDNRRRIGLSLIKIQQETRLVVMGYQCHRKQLIPGANVTVDYSNAETIHVSQGLV